MILLHEGEESRSRALTRLTPGLTRAGLALAPRDISLPQPLPTELGDVAGVITWFEGPLRAPTFTARWLAGLEQTCGTALPRAVLGDPGSGSGPLVAGAGLGDAAGLNLHDGSTRPVQHNWPGPQVALIPAGLLTAYPSLPDAAAQVTLPLPEATLTLLRADPKAGELFIHGAYLGQLDDPGRVVADALRPFPVPLPDLASEGALRLATITLDARGWDRHAPNRTGTGLGPTAGDLAEALLAPFPNLAVTLIPPENATAESAAQIASLAEQDNITLMPATRDDGMLRLELSEGPVLIAPSQLPTVARDLGTGEPGLPLFAPLRGESNWADPTGLHALFSTPLPDLTLHLRLAASDLLDFGARAAAQRALTRLGQPDVRVLDLDTFHAKILGAENLRIARDGPRRFTIKDRGSLQGLRLALPPGTALDLAASDGITEVVQNDHAIRLTLDKGNSQPTIALTPCLAEQDQSC
ncbi:MAG: hypothetical protein P1U53_16535 [Sulfitobacter sp.]|nr:hypothetical protein [Sulfitobacter sp.]